MIWVCLDLLFLSMVFWYIKVIKRSPDIEDQQWRQILHLEASLMTWLFLFKIHTENCKGAVACDDIFQCPSIPPIPAWTGTGYRWKGNHGLLVQWSHVWRIYTWCPTTLNSFEWKGDADHHQLVWTIIQAEKIWFVKEVPGDWKSSRGSQFGQAPSDVVKIQVS